MTLYVCINMHNKNLLHAVALSVTLYVCINMHNKNLLHAVALSVTLYVCINIHNKNLLHAVALSVTLYVCINMHNHLSKFNSKSKKLSLCTGADIGYHLLMIIYLVVSNEVAQAILTCTKYFTQMIAISYLETNSLL